MFGSVGVKFDKEDSSSESDMSDSTPCEVTNPRSPTVPTPFHSIPDFNFVSPRSLGVHHARLYSARFLVNPLPLILDLVGHQQR